MIIEDEKFGVNLNANELKLNYADEFKDFNDIVDMTRELDSWVVDNL